MSYLREIMQRLNSRTAAEAEVEPTPSPRLEAHLEDYRQRLLACTPAMLRYEDAWLEQHLETLELCLTQPGMLSTAGGPARVKILLEESRRFRELLDQRCRELELAPARHRAAVVASEHAWELSHPGLRSQWGLEPLPGSPV